MVGPSEIGEASRVKAFGKGLIEAHTFEVADFFVDTRNAGMLLQFFCTYSCLRMISNSVGEVTFKSNALQYCVTR